MAIAQRPPLPDADTVERPHYGIRQAVLLPSSLREILCGKLLEAIGGARRRGVPLGAFWRREFGCALENHARRQDGYLLKPATPLGVNRSIEGRRRDALVFRHEIISKLVKIGNASDRSEEHTSELQSPCNLVCRLLLEKKKKKKR